MWHLYQKILSQSKKYYHNQKNITIQKIFSDRGRKEGRNEGTKERRKEGRKKGRKERRNEGTKEGRKEGGKERRKALAVSGSKTLRRSLKMQGSSTRTFANTIACGKLYIICR